MNIDNAETILAVFITIAGMFGWIFKIWIINPLSVSIAALGRTIDRMDNVLRGMQTDNLAMRTDIVRVDSSAKSAHKRIDDLAERQTMLEKEFRGHD
nr:MAG TPA: hypothetical protein [Caudoviricetes sp.]